ncbi:MAG: flagellar secretion chaperone FliS [Mycobacteriales bacterium]|jgi:flagellar protein FliS
MTMTNPAAMRARYLADAVTTASPGRLIVMLYDRLVLDLSRAEAAIRGGDRAGSADRLLHAQEILLELRTSLDVTAWSGAPGLARLYSFLITELIGANVRPDADRVARCRALLEPLRDAWRDAVHAAPEPAAARVG